jgi:hypothetical protein
MNRLIVLAIFAWQKPFQLTGSIHLVIRSNVVLNENWYSVERPSIISHERKVLQRCLLQALPSNGSSGTLGV